VTTQELLTKLQEEGYEIGETQLRTKLRQAVVDGRALAVKKKVQRSDGVLTPVQAYILLDEL
jgi:hypothetical protein